MLSICAEYIGIANSVHSRLVLLCMRIEKAVAATSSVSISFFITFGLNIYWIL